jgi:hypothetical protein
VPAFQGKRPVPDDSSENGEDLSRDNYSDCMVCDGCGGCVGPNANHRAAPAPFLLKETKMGFFLILAFVTFLWLGPRLTV